jgi:hypothetical protein
VVADVREMKGHVKGSAGRLYLFCGDCGVVRSSGAVLQNYILKNGDFLRDDVREVEPVAVEKVDMWEGF